MHPEIYTLLARLSLAEHKLRIALALCDTTKSDIEVVRRLLTGGAEDAERERAPEKEPGTLTPSGES